MKNKKNITNQKIKNACLILAKCSLSSSGYLNWLYVERWCRCFFLHIAARVGTIVVRTLACRSSVELPTSIKIKHTVLWLLKHFSNYEYLFVTIRSWQCCSAFPVVGLLRRRFFFCSCSLDIKFEVSNFSTYTRTNSRLR